MRRYLSAVRVGLLFVAFLSGPAAASEWPAWDRFAERFIQADGRVIDLTFEGKSTSEGQSYGLFFALVANDRARFDRILQWTSDNLADGQLGQKLPAWHWGKRDDGSWGVKDPNAASDADLWIAYTLLEASRLWNDGRYARTARELLARIRKDEVRDAGAAGAVLLPGPVGFELDQGRFWLNPSYVPGFQFHYLAAHDPAGPWQAIWDGHLRLAPQLYRAGVAPDLFIVDRQGRVTQDTQRAPAGSYDAIRVYLWAGMSGGDSQQLLRLLKPYAQLIRKQGWPPEKVHPADARIIKGDWSPIGFAGAVLPFLDALGEKQLLQEQRGRIRKDAASGATTHYYDQVLILFGEGWVDGFYRFDAQGRVLPRWAAR